MSDLDFSQTIVGGRVGGRVRVTQHEGRYRLFFNVAKTKMRKGEKTTIWHPVVYWTSSEPEVNHLSLVLRAGTSVVVRGEPDLTTKKHQDAPVDITVYFIDADHVDVCELGAEAREALAANKEPVHNEMPSDPLSFDDDASVGSAPPPRTRPQTVQRPQSAPQRPAVQRTDRPATTVVSSPSRPAPTRVANSAPRPAHHLDF